MSSSLTLDSMDRKDAIRLFSDYLRVTGVARTGASAGDASADGASAGGDARLKDRRLGLLNGSSWITLWANFFGRRYLPEVNLINAGNDAVQINFMQAHQSGQAVPPRNNIETFTRYARDLVELAQVEVVLITCSTMNRAFLDVRLALEPYGVPVFQIDKPMMERAVAHGGKVLVVATHGPTVENTLALLRETAAESGRTVSYSGLTVEPAWHDLAKGDVEGHNRRLAEAIRQHMKSDEVGCVVLAQLSMTAFLLSHPDPVSEFGAPVFTSGECGFKFVREFLIHAPASPDEG